MFKLAPEKLVKSRNLVGSCFTLRLPRHIQVLRNDWTVKQDGRTWLRLDVYKSVETVMEQQSVLMAGRVFTRSVTTGAPR